MPLISVTPPSRRHTVRRAVALECVARGDLWNGRLRFEARDLSPDGLWLATPYALDPGAELVLSFRPPRWPVGCFPVIAVGEVVRVDMRRRRSDARPPGLGLRFTDIEARDQDRLYRVLRGLPPPLPPKARPDAIARVEQETSFALDDGQMITFRPLGPMISIGQVNAEGAFDERALPPALRYAC